MQMKKAPLTGMIVLVQGPDLGRDGNGEPLALGDGLVQGLEPPNSSIEIFYAVQECAVFLACMLFGHTG
jgi:hypothetical protein